MVAENIVESTLNNNEASREKMMLAVSAAGVGFGNAGVHFLTDVICHFGKRKGITLDGYPEESLIPHGLSVIINAPAVFRFTSTIALKGTLRCQASGVDISDKSSENSETSFQINLSNL